MFPAAVDQSNALNSLRTRWVAFIFACLCTLIAGFIFLDAAWEPVFARRWLLVSAIVSLYLVMQLRFSLKYNHRPGESRLMPTFGTGSSITLARGLFLAALAGFLTSPLPDGFLAWLPGLIYITASLLDYFDGYLARRFNQTTLLGEILDIRLDSLGVFAAAFLAIQYGQLPYWYLLVAFARYLYLFGLWLRKRAGYKAHELPPSVSRRMFAGLQMGFLTVMLLPLFSPPGTYIAALLFALPFLVGFVRDWLHAAGIFRTSERVVNSEIISFVSRWAALIIRMAVSTMLVIAVLGSVSTFNALFTPLKLIMLVNLIVAIMVALGIAGRLFSVVGLLMIGFTQIYYPLTPIQVLLAAGYVGLIYLGTGAYSLWKPEDYFLFHRFGAPQGKVVQAQSA